MIDFDKLPKAKIFRTHGVDFTTQRGDELIGTCPFTGKEGKFFVNSKTWLWDSKTAGLSGGIATFLEEISKEYCEEVDGSLRLKLAAHRSLPVEALTHLELGWTGRAYTIPVRNPDGRVVDIRMYQPKIKRMLSTAGCRVGLLGAEQLGQPSSTPVYLCEGEWDGLALRYLLQQVGKPGIVLAVPGAGVFKPEWVPWFNGRTVHVCYDHDEAGERGEDNVQQKLTGVAKALTFVHWPEDLPSGFDLRDWIVYGLKKGTLELCYKRLHKLFRASARHQVDREDAEVGRTAYLTRAKRPDATLDDVHRTFNKWLYLPSTDAVDVMLAVTVSQALDGPPLWMFLVSPPGGAKTVTLSALASYEHVFSTSSLTSHALISGANWQGQTDPSLIPRLDGKVLLVKDFTSILSMRDVDKEEIFGILRDAYDGRCGKIFGNGVERSYQSKFTVLAAVTPSIYDVGDRHASLGERFLKYAMGDNLQHVSENDIISRAIDNVDQDGEMRKELSDVTNRFLSRGLDPKRVPTIDNPLHHQIIALARFGARTRGTVTWDFRGETMRGRPFAEIGSRLGIQLAKLARSLAWVRGKAEVGPEEFRVVKKVMLDTVSQRVEDMVRHIYRVCPREDDAVSTPNLALATRYPMATITRLLQDMAMLHVVVRRGSGYRHEWALSPYIRKSIEEAGLYDQPQELLRKSMKPVTWLKRPRTTTSALGLVAAPGVRGKAGQPWAGSGENGRVGEARTGGRRP